MAISNDGQQPEAARKDQGRATGRGQGQNQSKSMINANFSRNVADWPRPVVSQAFAAQRRGLLPGQPVLFDYSNPAAVVADRRRT